MKYLCLFATLMVISCGSMTLKPLEKKYLKNDWVIKNNTSKKQAYERSLVFISKYITDSNSAIKVKDKELGRIMAKVIIPCVGFKRPDIINTLKSTDIAYNIDLSFKKGRSKIEIENLGFTKQIYGYPSMKVFVAQAEGQKEAVAKCMTEIKDIFKKAIIEKSKEW